jgi:hypothetical protein
MKLVQAGMGSVVQFVFSICYFYLLSYTHTYIQTHVHAALMEKRKPDVFIFNVGLHWLHFQQGMRPVAQCVANGYVYVCVCMYACVCMRDYACI